MNDESLGKFFSQKPCDGSSADESIPFDRELEHLAGFQKVVHNIELLKQMEAIDSLKALHNIKVRIEKRKGFDFSPLLQKAAAVLLIPLLAFALWQTNKINTFKQSVTQNEISTPATLRSVFTLPDGTKVWMNGGTNLKYPSMFLGNERLIELNGEAYFKVAPNKNKPFRVKTGNLYVEAVGTEFNCNAFSSENKMETVLTKGKVNITANAAQGRKVLAYLEPGQMIIYNKTDQKLTLEKVNTHKYTAWMEGKIIFHNDNINDVLNRLEHWYNVEFVIDPSLKLDYAFTGSFESEELKQMLKYIELTTPVKFEILKAKKNDDNSYEKTQIKIWQKKKS